jgi:uncharacterized phage protein gp47/JayE
MVDYGITPTGFRRKTFAVVRDGIATKWRALISERLRLDEDSVLGNILNPVADEIAFVWELLEGVSSVLDPRNAAGMLAEGTLEFAGIIREGARQGTVIAQVGTNVDAETEFEEGQLIAHVAGAPANRWINSESFTVQPGPQLTSVRFDSEGAGAQYRAPALSLSRIAESVTGWTSISNPLDASPGRDVESIEDAFIRFREGLAAQGAGTVEGIRADVAVVNGVQQVRVFANKTSEQVGDLPPKAVRVVIWDGVTQEADEQEVAQALYNSVGATTLLMGAYSGEVVTSEGQRETLNFDRAVPLDIYVNVTVVSLLGVDEQEVKDAIIARMPTRIGAPVVFEKLQAGPATMVEVDDVPSFTVGTSPGPTGTANIPVGNAQIAVLDSSNINVTILENW